MENLRQPEAQNASIFGGDIMGRVISDPTVLDMIAAARRGSSFAEMRREFGLAEQGTIASVADNPQNAFQTDRREYTPSSQE